MSLTFSEFNLWHRWTQAPLYMMNLIRNCIVNPNPTNQQIIFNEQRTGYSPFGVFLVEVQHALAKMHTRNLGRHRHDEGKSFDQNALQLAVSSLRFQLARPFESGSADFRAADYEINVYPQLIDAATLIKVINAFVFNAINKEKRIYIEAIARSWEKFTKSGSLFAAEMVRGGNGSFLQDLVTDGMMRVDSRISRLTDAPLIKITLDHQQKVANERGLRDYPKHRAEVLRIIERYADIMHPEILVYRRRPPQVISDLRLEFEDRERRAYLMSIAEKLRYQNKHLAPGQQYPQTLLQNLARGTFGQTSVQRNPSALTIEHTAPLSSGDNFDLNFSIVPSLINYDMEKLVLHQTRAIGLKGDVLTTTRDGKPMIERHGETLPIIILRPNRDPKTGLVLPIFDLPASAVHAPGRPSHERMALRQGKMPDRIP